MQKRNETNARRKNTHNMELCNGILWNLLVIFHYLHCSHSCSHLYYHIHDDLAVVHFTLLQVSSEFLIESFIQFMRLGRSNSI